MSVVTNHAHADDHHDQNSVRVFGFWVYILSDVFLFATIFATFAVFSSAYGTHYAIVDGVERLVTGKVLFADSLGFVLVETFLLLFSSITYGLAMVQVYRKNLSGTKMWLGLTFLLGLGFICMEVYEFYHLIHAGHGPGASAYLSAYFTLVGTHGIHVTSGLIWMACMFVHLSRKGLSEANVGRLSCLSLFWHFLDVIWIGVFTVVYLMGVL